MPPARDHTGTPGLVGFTHFHSSTISGSAPVMISRTLLRTWPRQSPSSLIRLSICCEAPLSATVLLGTWSWPEPISGGRDRCYRRSDRGRSRSRGLSGPGGVPCAVPFPDELRPVAVVPYRPGWEAEFSALAERIWALRLAEMGEVEHVGSTSVPHLAAKDVIDVQVRVDDLDPELVTERFAGIGFRRRPEEWNNLEDTRRGPVPKLVFAPPVDARHVNVHVRVDGSQGARDTLLFRDFLRAEV